MDIKDAGFFKELIKIFKMETQEHIQEMLSGIPEIGRHQGTDQQFGVAETLHRAAHSLKGAARTVGLSDIEPLCQGLESFFSLLKRQKVMLSPEFQELLMRTVQELGGLLNSMDDEGKITGDKTELSRLIEEVQSKTVELARSS